MKSHRIILVASVLALPLTAPRAAGAQEARVAVAGLEGAGAPAVGSAAARRQYGDAIPLGKGTLRPYVTVDPSTKAPVEIGVALSELAMEGLPAAGAGHAGGHEGMIHTYNLPLPEGLTPFRFIEVNWNPAGHEPEGVYLNVPHFDFHFYTISQAARDAIVPSDPQYAAKATRLPAKEYAPPFNVALAPPGATLDQVAVPKMGVHWVDVRTPELQGVLGKPEAFRPFTTTFLHGSWDGRFIFWEPMITRAYIMAKKAATDPAVRDEVIGLPIPAAYQVAGAYPQAYRITWDAKAQEYRIALTGLATR